MAKVAILMGSASDYEVVKQAGEALKEFGVEFTIDVMSAHRTPDEVIKLARGARGNGYGVIIAAAGMAAHLAGFVAANTTLPVVAVPIYTKQFGGMDALLASVQMPSGIPVATVAVDGAKNAGLLAVEILSVSDSVLADKLEAYRIKMAQAVKNANEEIKNKA